MQFQPAIMLPMHYNAPEHARRFMELIEKTIPVRPVREATLKVTRTTLSGASEVIVLDYREEDR